ncbi:nitrate reductase, partial [Roseomonas sp. GC11]|uniref:molybdopterin oxidoreductase family protein n=1 Tax=Roseomonas sp. GC11 TaxID=2950546 RepID=UPI00210CD04A
MTRSTCPYCGVGCGVVAEGDAVRGDPAHPANQGRLCVKGAALAETLGPAGRLTTPMVQGAPVGWDAALDRIAARFRATIAAHGPDSVAFYVSGQCLTEDYYVANKLMKGFIGSANIDTNSRLCMASSVAGHVRAFGEDVVPGLYADLEEADLVLLVGSNLAWCHPVLHQRLRAARAARGTRVILIDPRRTASAEEADLHLPLAPGSDVALFNGLLAYLAECGALDTAWAAAHLSGLEEALAAARAEAPDVPRLTELHPAALAEFYAAFAATPRVVTLYSQGVNQSAAGTDKVNAILNCHLATGRIGRPGAGPFSLTGQPNAMGGREVGGLANQLAAHLRFDRAEDLALLRGFWGAPNLATRPGLKAIDLFEAVREGRVKALWVIATNPAASLPRNDRVREALAACPFLVVSDGWANETTAFADTLLPAALWGERDGTVTNSERVISRQRPFRAPPGAARPDWWALAEVGRRMGWPEAFAWTHPAEIFAEHAALSGHGNDGARVFDISAHAGIGRAAYDALEPFRWPARPGQKEPAGRLFAAGGFPTPDGRARCLPLRHRAPAEPASRTRPLLLNTGRLRDQWHSMTRTGRVPRLMRHAPEPLAAFHPADAARLGLVEGGLARLASAQGEQVTRVTLDAGLRPGEVFVPMHWTDSFTSAGPVARLVGAATDPVSGQPEMKATPLSATPLPVLWRGLLLHRAPPEAPPESPLAQPGLHWSRLPLEQGQALDLAGWQAMPEGAALEALATALLGPTPAETERLELRDPARGLARYALLREGRLEAALFLARAPAALPAREALA